MGIRPTVRGYDLYIMGDVTNYSLTYTVCGQTNHMAPDDHYAYLKRVIAAAGGKARRITVIMPFLYESRPVSYTHLNARLRQPPASEQIHT